jgi:ATP-binding cassette subfamily B protein
MRKKNVFLRTFLLIAPFRWHIFLVVLLNLAVIPISLLLPVPLKIVVDSVLGDGLIPRFMSYFLSTTSPRRDSILIFAAGLMLFLAVLRLFVELTKWLLEERTGQLMVLELRGRMFERAQQVSLSYHDTRGINDTLYRIQHDAPSLQWLVIWQVIPLVSATALLFCTITIIFALSPRLAAVALIVSPIFIVLAWIYSGRLKRQWEETKQLETRAFSVPHEVLAGLRITKAFAQEQREHSRFANRLLRSALGRLRVVESESVFALLLGLTIAMGTTCVLYLGTRSVQDGQLTVGQLLVVMAYLAALYDPLQTIGRQLTGFQGPLVGMRRCFELLDQPDEVAEAACPTSMVRTRGEVVFDNVSFSYPRGKQVLDRVSICVPPGSSLGISGPTGSGKSTLVSLLMRFYDPTDGHIFLDGVDLRDIRLSDLRRQFSIVLQETSLFSGTVYENISYGRSEATAREVFAAAEAANAREFIERLPEGFRSLVGDRGVQLSGGERQRIALARAFVKNSPILILDEPTSAVDVETENLIMEALKRLMHGRTTFMIAHRISTLNICHSRFKLGDRQQVDKFSQGPIAAG